MYMTPKSDVSDSLSLCIALFRAQAALSRRFDGRLGSWHGMSFGDFNVLLQISRAADGRLRRVDLARELGLTASAVTRILIPLEKIGLVKRLADENDGRVGYAVLTKAGKEILREAMESAEMISQEVITPKAAARLSDVGEFFDSVIE
jgi:DNA-binding MarR family transcriptional regulator